MYKNHTTKDGETIMICQMKDSHLRNTIIYLIRRMREAQTYIKSNNSDSFNMMNLVTNESNVIRVNVTMAKCIIKRTHEVLPDYLFEANLRGLSMVDITSLLQLAYSRKSAMITNTLHILTAADEDDFDQDESDRYDAEHKEDDYEYGSYDD